MSLLGDVKEKEETTLFAKGNAFCLGEKHPLPVGKAYYVKCIKGRKN